jgi:hypothetical protein
MKITIKELKTLIKSVISESKTTGKRMNEVKRWVTPDYKKYPEYFDDFEFVLNNKLFIVSGVLESYEESIYDKIIMKDKENPDGIDISGYWKDYDDPTFEKITGVSIDDFVEYADEKIIDNGYDRWQNWEPSWI